MYECYSQENTLSKISLYLLCTLYREYDIMYKSYVFVHTHVIDVNILLTKTEVNNYSIIEQNLEWLIHGRGRYVL